MTNRVLNHGWIHCKAQRVALDTTLKPWRCTGQHSRFVALFSSGRPYGIHLRCDSRGVNRKRLASGWPGTKQYDSGSKNSVQPGKAKACTVQSRCEQAHEYHLEYTYATVWLDEQK